MTPREVAELSRDERAAFVRYMKREIKAANKAAARAGRRR